MTTSSKECLSRLATASRGRGWLAILVLLSILGCWPRGESSCHGPSRHAQLSPTHGVTQLPALSNALNAELRKPGRASPDSEPYIVMLAIDGVRWQEVFRGVDANLERRFGAIHHERRGPNDIMPNLHRLTSEGAVLLGADDTPMFASSPNTVSLPGYSEMMSGRTPICATNNCPPTRERTILDDIALLRPSLQLAIVTSWSRIPRVAARNLTSVTVSAGRKMATHLENICADERLCSLYRAAINLPAWPGTKDYRPDVATAAIALRYLEARNPNFLFIGLGDTDKYAHRGNYDSYLAALAQADQLIGQLNQWVTQQRNEGRRALLIVTADHGRSAGFVNHWHTRAAARVWALLSGLDLGVNPTYKGVRSRLADLAPTMRELLGMRRDADPRAGHSLLSQLHGINGLPGAWDQRPIDVVQ